ncbi:MAG TPA: hypothetical protein VFS08_04895 [Gemmatimonadaceae bacterium]|nr:hypothetical protein [Gemmatimonadaceae bacterium]
MHTTHRSRPARAVAAGLVVVVAVAASVLRPTVAAAQESAPDSTGVVQPPDQPCTYARCALRVEDGWFSRRLVRGPEATVVARLGFGGPSLASIVQRSDSAVAHARRYQSAQRTGDIVSLIGTVGTVAALFALDDESGARDEAIAVNIASVVVFVVGQSFHFKAQRELSRSLWWYNRDVLGAP